jgi:hypothetical protein
VKSAKQIPPANKSRPVPTKPARPRYPPVITCEEGTSPERLEELKKQATDELNADLMAIIGVESASLALHLINQATGPLSVGARGDAARHDAINLTMDMLTEIGPKGAMQGMLAAQMCGVHAAASEFIQRALHPEQPSEMVDRNIQRAGRLMRLFAQQLDSMQKLKGLSGQQTVTVEHVTVNAGGQAIVGAVNTGKSREGVGDE